MPTEAFKLANALRRSQTFQQVQFSSPESTSSIPKVESVTRASFVNPDLVYKRPNSPSKTASVLFPQDEETAYQTESATSLNAKALSRSPNRNKSMGAMNFGSGISEYLSMSHDTFAADMDEELEEVIIDKSAMRPAGIKTSIASVGLKNFSRERDIISGLQKEENVIDRRQSSKRLSVKVSDSSERATSAERAAGLTSKEINCNPDVILLGIRNSNGNPNHISTAKHACILLC